MVNIVGSREDFGKWKPADKQDYLTLQQLADVCGRQRRWLIVLEGRGDIPKPIRHKVGRLSVRLYSPGQVERIMAYFKEIDAKREKDRKDPAKRKHRVQMREFRKRQREEGAK